jgi:cysteine desulfurase
MQRIYFDHNATSILDQRVKESMIALMGMPLNPSSVHQEGNKARQILEEGRKVIKTKLSLLKSHKLIFTSSCTEANNLVLRNFPSFNKICSTFEHASVKKLIKSQVIPITSDGIIDLNALEVLLREDQNILLSVMYANNEIGSVQPIQEIAMLIRRLGGLFHCDITQALGRVPVSLENVDLITLSSHKFGGPTGAGALLIREGLEIEPVTLGGGQEFGMRSGTHNVIAVCGMATAFASIDNITASFSKLSLLRDSLEDDLLSIDQKIMIAAKNSPRLPNTSSIYMPNVDAETQLIFFDMNGFAVSAGSACSSGKGNTPSTHLAMGIKKSVARNFIRVSLGPDCNVLQMSKFRNCWHDLYRRNN